MTNVQDIFCNSNRIERLEDEEEIFDSLKDYSDEWLKFLSILTLENNMDLNNVRWFSSKELIIAGMAMLIIHKELLEGLIEQYKNKHGLTHIIKKTESALEKMTKSNDETLKSFKHLIDFQECENKVNSLIY